jgi:hypothetical protein
VLDYLIPTGPADGAPFTAKGRIEYTDIFGCRHWTNFCATFRLGTMKGNWCEDHNSVGTYESKERPGCAADAAP